MDITQDHTFTEDLYTTPLTNTTTATNTTYVYPFITLTLSCSSSTLSLIGGLFIVVTYILLPDIRNFTRQLVVCLTIADLLTASGILMSAIRYFNMHSDVIINEEVEDGLCKAQSFLTTFSSLVSFFLTSFIAIYLCDTIVERKDRFTNRRRQWLIIFNVISWGLPGCIVIAALANNVLGGDPTPEGATGPWCWIAEDVHDSTVWMVVTGKGWEISCYLITATAVLFILTKLKLYQSYKKKTFHAIQKNLRDEDKNFLYIWLVLYIIRFWGTLRFFLYIYVKPTGWESYMEAFLYLQALGDPAQAFCNFLLLCVFDETVRQQMIRKFRDWRGNSGDESEEQLLDISKSETTAQTYKSFKNT